MREDWEERVRERPYAIREREGRPEAGAERHWDEAERGRGPMRRPASAATPAPRAASP